MSSISVKRILRDVMNIKKDPLEDQGIFIHWDEADIKKVKALIIGPEDTPYAFGNYLFDITFPDEYPHKPPTVKYQTRYGNIRFNPNLYCCGKVCVSILNTWSGPQWTSCQSLRSVLLSLQSLLNENPLHNEPGYETENGDKCQKYNQILTYENFNIAILNYIKNPGSFDIFLPQMREMFVKNYSKIINNLNKYKNKNNQKIYSPVYNMNSVTSYKKITEGIEQLYLSFTKDSDYPGLNVDMEKEVQQVIESKNPVVIKKKKRKAPNENSKNFSVGYIQLSTNDNQKYIVYEDKNKIKKWKKYYENVNADKTIEI